ncbi:MAG TPA: NFACT family protein [Pyrinomonadaceae bacterium]|nr:NFACT family protein [Pyrinomonadaceae bacterium]
MDDQTIRAVVEEITPILAGRVMGKVFQLSRVELAIDFRTRDGRYLFLSVEPARPRLYLIARRVRDLEKQSLAPSPFALLLRKHLGGATLLSLMKDEGERIVRFSFTAHDEAGNSYSRTLVAQLTGRSANLLLLDERGRIIDTLRPPRGAGQEVGESYQPPPGHTSGRPSQASLTTGRFDSPSEAADKYYLQLEAERDFDARAAALRARVRKEIEQRTKLQHRLMDDLAGHGDAEEHKRIGDLLLANIATAERRGRTIIITDYYALNAPRIELEMDENSTLQEEAARRFARYAKAKRAAQEITRRLAELGKELERLYRRQSEIERIIAERDHAALEAFSGETKEDVRRTAGRRQRSESIPGVRRYRSSDGYEILVGRAARDNDHLTFRLARPHDLWLHAADYPGSHVIVRNPTRADIPHRTIIEAAQLAASFSQARTDTKVNVHYTPRKYLSKPKGAAPGLVRMSSFRTITVEPRDSAEARLKR